LTFLNPIALIGLLAAGIPILLHIFNLRKLKTIEFSTLSFLKELQKTKIRRLKLRQLLLLVLRTLLVILIVFAFSRPTLKGSLPGGLAEQAKTTAVIVFDDSQSMTASDEQGELLHQAKNAANAVLDLFKDGDEVFLLKLSDVQVEGSPEIPSTRRGFPAIRSAINEIKPSSVHRTIEDALRFTSRLLAASQNFNKEVYLISDFQSGSLESKTHTVKTSEKLFTQTTQFFLIPLGKRELQNVSIESIAIPSTIFEVNKPFTVKAKLINHGTSNLQNHIVSIYQDGSRVGQKGIDILAGQSVETEFTLVPKHPGFIEGKMELEDDDLEFDNTRFFTVHIPEELHVLLVGNTLDLTYLHIALDTRLTDSSVSLKINQITYDRFSSSHLNNTDVVILSNLHELTHDQSFALKMFLQNGGGMIFFPGAQTTSDAFNTTIAVPLGISTVSTATDIIKSQLTNSFIEFDKVDLHHPLFTGMFEEAEVKQSAGTSHRQRVLESPHINKSFLFSPTSKSQSIITLTNGYPFLMEEQVGGGHVLLFSVAANTEWSDLPLKGLFVLLVHRSLAYLVQESAMEHSLLVDEEAIIHLRTAIPLKLTITKPGGMQIFINPQQVAAERSIRFSDNDLPGFYTIASDNLILDKFVVNVDPDESNTTPSDEKHRDNMFRRIGIVNQSIHKVNQMQEVQHIITESRLGTELWKQFLLAALLIAIIEMFVARDNKRYHSSTVKQINNMKDSI
jgi:hypothetical protein